MNFRRWLAHRILSFLGLDPALGLLTPKDIQATRSKVTDSQVDALARLSEPYRLSSVRVGRYSYVAKGSHISQTTIGAFCSIGPNFLCGWGIHPLNGLSTHPLFYSHRPASGLTLTATTKVEERLPIQIGNDVFIGSNVTVLDGITIGDGAVIGAGTTVTKDVPPYAVVYGSPDSVRRLRFAPEQVEQLLQLAWWNWPLERLGEVEKDFFNIDEFLAKHR